MGVVVFIVGLVALVALIGFKINSAQRITGGVIVQSVFGLVGLIVLSNLAGAVVVVGAGERVVVFDKFSGLKKEALNEGLHLVVPFIQDTITFDVRVQKEEFETTAASKDLQDVSTKVALNVHPDADAVPLIYKNYGTNYSEKVIHPAVQEAVKAVTALYTAEELITKREAVKRQIQEHLAVLLKQANLVLTETYLTNFKFSEGFSHAIEQKQIAEQNALTAKNTLAQVKIEAEQTVAKAQAEAQGLRAQREAITPQLLELRRIEAQREAITKWNGTLPQTMIGGGSVPFINLNTDKQN